MIVLGSGVIACEYASIFAALGCAVTLVDKAAEPLGFLDAPLRAGFLAAFRSMGGNYLAGAEVRGARFDGFSQVEVALVAFDLPPPALTSLVPTGVYTIPEIACVGMSQTEAAQKKIDVLIGRADFREVARAHIAGEPAGFLTLLCDAASLRVLGVQVLGEGATELVHLGQAAVATGATFEFFIEQIFNFPTMTEAYRIAAFDVMKQRTAAKSTPVRLARTRPAEATAQPAGETKEPV